MDNISLIKELRLLNIITKNDKLNPRYKVKFDKHPDVFNRLKKHTDFLDFENHGTIKERIYCIINNLVDIPACSNDDCSNKRIFHTNGKNNNNYGLYCSSSCAARDSKRSAKILNTKLGNPTKWLQERATARHTHCHDNLNIPTDVLEKLSNPDWLIDQHINQHKSLKRISSELNVSSTAVQQRIAQYGIPVNHGCCKTTVPENELVNFISGVYDGEIITNDRTIINPYEIDIYLPDVALAFEFNGVYWHSDKHKRKDYHKMKTEMCAAIGVQLIHVWEYQWNDKQEIVKSIVMHMLNKTQTRIYARHTTIRNVSSVDSVRFLNSNHIQGNVNGSLRYGLYYDNILVALMTFGKSRYGDADYELLRFANKVHTVVVGGASKLLNHFKNQKPDSIVVSYSHNDRGSGMLYQQLGFTKTHTTEPGYVYYKNGKVYSRVTFQKHKLHAVLESYDDSLTEYDNMMLNGYLRLWDSGNTVWLY